MEDPLHRSQFGLTGKDLAQISDAGTPGISDPGFLLVRACVQAGLPVNCLPGATAIIPALVVSGLPCDKFHFEGFLPHKKGRQTRLKYLAELKTTFALYESPHRLVKCLKQLSEFCGEERQAVVCRELTKMYEEIKRGTLEELITHFGKNAKVKGEITALLEERISGEHFEVLQVSITDFTFSAKYMAAIEAKQVAEQAAQQAQNELERNRLDVKKLEQQATAEAAATLTRVQAEAQAMHVRAEADAEYHRKVGKAATANSLRHIELQRWNGVAPLYVGEGSLMLPSSSES